MSSNVLQVQKGENSAILCRFHPLHPNSNAEKSQKKMATWPWCGQPTAPRRHCFVTCYPLETPELPATLEGILDDAMNAVGFLTT